MPGDRNKKNNKGMPEDRKKEYLSVLTYDSDRCHTILVKLSELESKAKDMDDIDPKSLEIDFENRTWSFYEHKNIPIGKGRKDLGKYNFSRFGVLGVYDRSIDEHLEQLVSDVQTAIELPHGTYVSHDD